MESASRNAMTLGEIHDGGGVIEQASEVDIRKVAELSAFMHEKLVVYVHPGMTSGDLPVIVVTVNGTNQPIIRGRQQTIRRKYVESLARSRITNYEQATPDSSKPENIQMIPNSSPTYPFSVYEDPNRLGPAWLEAIMSQP